MTLNRHLSKNILNNELFIFFNLIYHVHKMSVKSYTMTLVIAIIIIIYIDFVDNAMESITSWSVKMSFKIYFSKTFKTSSVSQWILIIPEF